MDVLRDAVGFDTALFTWTDAQAEVVDSQIVLGPDFRHILHAYLTEYANTVEASYILSFRDVLLSDALCESSDRYGKRYQESPVYDDIGRQVDCYHYLRWPIREAGAPLGCLTLTRPRGTKAFSEKQRTFIRLTTDTLTHALACRNSGEACADQWEESGEEAFLICNEQGQVQHFTHHGRALLHLAAGIPANTARLLDAALAWAEPLLQQVTKPLASSREQNLPAVTVRNHSGIYLLRGFRLDAVQKGTPSLVSVQISRRIPSKLKWLGAPAMRLLPGRDQEVALALIAGKSAREIGESLGISHNSVAYHIRSIYNRLGTSRRDDLAAAMLGMPRCNALGRAAPLART
ncbi:helix-turn-helix transcriptional regulator [Methylogaea oryzae]|uniref:helix-turn-helix transcriptional regulator n=1 Tax=Methylogaea oryzae TaxID=1295382 RepID=UPI001C8183BD|nr:helix-turn-helix transcriptional regulator [Methylogaea oryzae]